MLLRYWRTGRAWSSFASKEMPASRISRFFCSRCEDAGLAGRWRASIASPWCDPASAVATGCDLPIYLGTDT